MKQMATEVPAIPAKPKAPTIVLTGGGTGGHITPLLAVAQQLKKLRGDLKIIYIGERHGKFASMLENNSDIDEFYTIFAGKFRRYHGESWWKRALDLKTNALNARDAVFVLIGIVQAYFLLGRLRPNITLLKGGFVGMPVGLAAAVRKQRFITHDSDFVPGLANRLVSRWAELHATAMPAEYYGYPKSSVRHIGVLVTEDYKPIDPVTQKQYRINIGISPASKVLLVTGGSLGARAINLAMVKVAPKLLAKFSDLHIIHQVGKGNLKVYGHYAHPRLKVMEFLKPLAHYMGSADLILTRAGANTLAEIGVLGKASLIVPNPYLTGGHQLKNAEYLLQHKATQVVEESKMVTDPGILETTLEDLLSNSNKRHELSTNLQKLTIPDASQRLALLLLELAS